MPLLLALSLLSGCGILSGLAQGSRMPAPSSAAAAPTEPKSEAAPEPTEIADPSLKALRECMELTGCRIGAAAAGPAAEDCTAEQLRAQILDSDLGLEYPFLADSTVVLHEGGEVYLLAPREGGSLTIYPSEMGESGACIDDRQAPLYEGAPGETILLRCNVSDLYANVLISADGGACEFRPMLSLKDGKLNFGEGVYDFSVYPEENPNVRIATELLLEADEVRYYSEELGLTLLYLDEHRVIEGHDCLLFALGTMQEQQFVAERYYAVCDNLIYSYDAINDSWSALGAG